MSGPQARPFKGRLGFDANNDKVVNLADPSDLQDGMNLRYFIATNTVQTFDPTRGYPAGFIVEYSDRLFKTKEQIGAGPFNLNQWTEIHAFGRWLRITGAYTADPGDNLFVSTQDAPLKITLPFPAEDGDIVTIIDEGFAKTNPITVTAGTNTINNISDDYNINSQDICQFIYLGGTWKVSREEKSTYKVIADQAVLAPNSFNLVPSGIANKTVYLPPKPIDGQWVTLVDSTIDGGNYYTTINGNGNVINGLTTFTMNRFGSQVTCVYDAFSGGWKAASNQGERKIPNASAPLLPSQAVYVPLTSSAQVLTLPTSVAGDWVEIISTAQDGSVNGGSIVVNASSGTYFRTTGGTQNSTSYRIKRRGKTLFLLQPSGEWAVVQLENGMAAVSNITDGTLLKNTLTTLTGSTNNTIYLPSNDTIQIGDYVSAQLNTSVGRVLVSVSVTSTDTLDGATTATYLAADNGMVVTFVYRGWNGTKNVWETINHGSAYLKKSQNLADLPDKALSRTNLDVFSKGESDLRFLPLHGTADNALQAANADKLDGLHGADYIQVKNPSVTAVDANTTTETRFTTNTNTPDSTLWQVVMFVDTTTGSKAQIAMNLTSNTIAYRSWNTTWSLWTRLDQSANADSATKLQTPRAISIGGDATGTVQFDGTSDVTIPVSGVMATRLKPVATTTNTDTATGVFTKICSISTPIPGLDNDVQIRFVVIPRKTAGGAFAASQADVTLRFRGSLVQLVSNQSASAYELGYVIVSGGLDLYWKGNLNSLYATVHEIGRSLSDVNSIQWLSSQPISSTQPDGYLAARSYVTYTDNYHPLADKLTTPRTITVTGGANGSVAFDGSGDVNLNLTMNPTGTQFEISNVNGLQSALDNKLGLTSKANDSDKLDGFDSLDFKMNYSDASNVTSDPNTTLLGVIMTNHANTPDGGNSNWFVESTFHGGRLNNTNCFQTAKQYSGPAVYFRNRNNNVWTSWVSVSTLVDGGTYNINVTGSSGSTLSAAKLTTPRTINGVPFDGTANITVADATKMPTSGGVWTGQTRRELNNGALSWRTIDSPMTSTVDGATTGTMVITLPVAMNNTMMKFSISVYNYATNTSFTINVAGYNYSTGWTTCTATSDGSSIASFGDTIRFAKNGSQAAILIGTTTTAWQYPKVTIRSVELGYTGAFDSTWTGPWTLGYTTNESAISGVVSAQIDPWVAKVERSNTFSYQQTFSASGTQIRSLNGNVSALFYNDNSNFYLMKTARGDQYGSFDSTRPFYMNLTSGDVTFGQNVYVAGTTTLNSTVNITGVLTTTAQANFTGGTTSAGWYRSTGQAGWVSDSYGGGIYMIDTTWVRVYGSKALYVGNEIAATGNITAYYSDARLKENLKVISNALETVKSWTGYTYNANVTAQSFGYDPTKQEIGLLAQDVQKTTPEAVEQAPFDRTAVKGKSLTGKHYLTLKYERLVPVLVEAVKEQDREIQELKQQVASLMEAFKTLGK